MILATHFPGTLDRWLDPETTDELIATALEIVEGMTEDE